MPEQKKHSPGEQRRTTDWVKLPATLDSPGYKKPSDEFTFTFATAKKYLDPYIQDMQAKLGSSGVLFYIPCAPDEVEKLLGEAPDAPEIGSLEPEVIGCPPISVSALAELLGGMTERNVQILEAKGTVVRVKGRRGQYDRDQTISSLWKTYKESESGATDAYNDEKLKGMRLRRQERELDYYERAGKLGNIDSIQSVIEKAKAAEKQQVLFMPKQLAPMLEGDPAVNEAVLDEWARQFLKGQTEINLRADLSNGSAPDADKMPNMKKRNKRKKKK